MRYEIPLAVGPSGLPSEITLVRQISS
jgi:hypothetical protein